MPKFIFEFDFRKEEGQEKWKQTKGELNRQKEATIEQNQKERKPNSIPYSSLQNPFGVD